jgi:Ser/Thr protein kinase RdoA (MazF antagonist)
MISTEEFAELSLDEQIRRLQQLGEVALNEFKIQPELIERLIHAENTTFKITAPQGRFNLRISRPGYQSTSNIQSEILFLKALRDAGFRVPMPWQDRLVPASHENVPESRNCVLFGWLQGEFSGGVMTIDRAHKIGQVMARLHEFSREWTLPHGFDRQHLHKWAFEPRQRHPMDEPTPLAFEEDRLLMIEVDAEARTLLASLQTDPDWYGLIHSDLHLGNVLFEGDELNIIDFDDTGFGFWHYDFAAALAYPVGSDDFSSLQEAMLDGYLQIRSLPPQTSRLMSPFLQLRLNTICKWVVSRADNPHFRETGADFVHRLCTRIRKLRSQ